METFTCLTCAVNFDCEVKLTKHFHEVSLRRRMVSLESSGIVPANQKEGVKEPKKQRKKKKKRVKEYKGPRQYEDYSFVKSCLFCNLLSENLQDNLKHMGLTHGFLIPDHEYVVDYEAMLLYMQQKIRIDLVCLHCNSPGFKTPQSVQQHMLDKQHIFLDNKDTNEYEPFYNWGDDSFSLLSDQENEEFLDIESISSFSNIAIPRDLQKAIRTNLYGELLLSNGKLAGNKHFIRYYKQYFLPRPEHRNTPMIKSVKSSEYFTGVPLPHKKAMQVTNKVPMKLHRK